MAGRCTCPQTCNCCSGSSSSVGVVGTGSIGQCFTPEVIYSADAGNRAHAGGDGGVYASTCLLGPDGTPITPDADGCVTVPPPCLLDQGGDPIAPNEAGCVQLPANTPPAYDCGLEQDEAGVLSVKTPGTWPGADVPGLPFAGTVDAGADTFCTDAGVRGVPDHTIIGETAADTLLAPTLETVSGTYDTVATLGDPLVNPSAARRMQCIAFCSLTVDLSAPADSGSYVRMQVRINGGSWLNLRELRFPETTGDGAPTIRSKLELTGQVLDLIGAGDGWVPEIRCQVQKMGSGEDPVLISVNAKIVAEGRTI